MRDIDSPMFRKYLKSSLVLPLALLSLFSFVFAQGITDLKTEIHSKLKCCSCPDSFARCTCPEAKEMKAYIDALLESGISREEIFYKVAKKFSLNTILDEKIKKYIEKRLSQEAGEKRPQIILDYISFNFGTMSKKKGEASKVFRVKNLGNVPLIIKQMKTSCPCATVSLKLGQIKSPYFGNEGSPKDWQMEMKSGESGELKLMIDLASSYVKTGRLIRNATIVSNDPVYPEITIAIEAQVTE